MRIIITGASGFIGSQIIPFLEKAGAELLLAGRDEKRMQKLYPDFNVTSYTNLGAKAAGYDSIVHLAIMNNDQEGTKEDFFEANVELLKMILGMAKSAKINTFINTTTLHAIESNNTSLYALSKREAENLLSKVTEINVVNLRLPAVYGNTYKGKLALLNKIPSLIRPLAFQILAALKPTANVELVAKAVWETSHLQSNTDRIITDKQNKNYFYHGFKRIVDLLFALFIIIVFWWALIGAWLAVKLSSPGPGIFKQQRVGKNKKLFTCYKFRTMPLGTKQAGTHELSSANITNVGDFLRKTKIDELPQVWNIIKNELSLVGPRPCLPIQKDLITARDELNVFNEKGGITGWAQIKNVDMSDPIKLSKLDAEYQALRTIPMDIKIIIATATGKGQGDKVS